MTTPSASEATNAKIEEKVTDMNLEDAKNSEKVAENPLQPPPEVVEKPKEPEKKKLFKTKKIRFGPIEYQIVMQDENGPCPLIAIVNCLVLKGKLEIPVEPSDEDLLNLISNLIFSRAPQEEGEAKENYEKNFNDVLTILPKIVDGLDVNIQFSGVDKFEYTTELSLFDLVGVKLYHVWLPDPQLTVIYDLVAKLNYNELVEKMFLESNEAEILKTFHEDSIAQITFVGLAALLSTMKDGDIAVLFQNNHFSTILKRRDEIFKLVTDQGYIVQPEVVWETLSSCDGDSILVNPDFSNFHYRAAPLEHHEPPASFEVVQPPPEPIEVAEEAVESMPTPSTSRSVPRSQTDQFHAPQTVKSQKKDRCVVM